MKLAIYFHIPFCLKKCPYCDFSSWDDLELKRSDYVEALLGELEAFMGRVEGPVSVSSIYLGGGTPSLLDPGLVGKIIDSAAKRACIAGNAEITIEVNPGTAGRSRFADYRAAGVNRAIIGVQSTDGRTLENLGRIHGAEESVQAFEDARSAGFDSVGIDLIYGIPGQTPLQWAEDLKRAISMQPDHVSAYMLKAPPGWHTPEDDLLCRMYRQTVSALENSGLAQYEVSNFAASGKKSRHNVAYWKRESYLGLGAAAHSFLQPRHIEKIVKPTENSGFQWATSSHEARWGIRWANVKDVNRYVELCRKPGGAIEERDILTRGNALDESIMLGLRLRGGLDAASIGERFGEKTGRLFAALCQQLAEEGMGTFEKGLYKLASEELLLADEIAALIVAGMSHNKP